MMRAGSYSVMLVNDNEHELRMHKNIVSQLGLLIYVHSCCEPKKALELLKEINSGTSDYLQSLPGIIIVDNDMNKMTGFKFLKEFSKIPFRSKEKPAVVMVCSSLDNITIQLLVEKGSSGCLTKPLTSEKLFQLIWI